MHLRRSAISLSGPCQLTTFPPHTQESRDDAYLFDLDHYLELVRESEGAAPLDAEERAALPALPDFFHYRERWEAEQNNSHLVIDARENGAGGALGRARV